MHLAGGVSGGGDAMGRNLDVLSDFDAIGENTAKCFWMYGVPCE